MLLTFTMVLFSLLPVFPQDQVLKRSCSDADNSAASVGTVNVAGHPPNRTDKQY